MNIPRARLSEGVKGQSLANNTAYVHVVALKELPAFRDEPMADRNTLGLWSGLEDWRGYALAAEK